MPQPSQSTTAIATGLLLATVAALSFSTAAFAADANDRLCPWIATQDVDRVLEDGAPWTPGKIARDNCRFAGERNGNRLHLSIERTLHANADEARAQAEKLRTDLEGALVARSEPTIGEAGFSGHARITGGELVRAAGHRGAAYVQATVADPSGTTDNQRNAMTRFVDIVLGNGLASRADEPQCPWLTPSLALDIVPGAVLTHPSEETCELRNDDVRLVVEVKSHVTADDLVQYLHDPECTHEPIPALGGNARVVWDCPRLFTIEVMHAEGNRVVTYTLRGKPEATPALRARLVEIAVAMRDARAR